MKNLSFRTWTIPLALLVLCGVSFGLLAPWLGFYWDDWPTIWYLHLLGPSGFREVFSVDRPMLGWLFMLTTSILGESTLAWQVFGVLTRWACCLAFWWALRQVWPRNTRQVTWAAFLFAVYPGFTQQYIAVTYSHTWITQAAFYLSLGLMVKAVKGQRISWPLLAAAWLPGVFTLFSDEYFFGLELLRPVFLWLALGQAPGAGQSSEEQGNVPLNDGRQERLSRLAIGWLPYLAAMAAFLYWRLFLHASPRGHVQVFGFLASSPLGTVIDLAKTVLKDAIQTSLVAWAQVLDFPRMVSFGKGPLALYAVVVAVAVPLVWFYLGRLRAAGGEEPAVSGQRPAVAQWPFQSIAVGTLALLVAGIPFWVTYLPIELRFPWDRFTLPMMMGASLLGAGLLELVPGRMGLKIAALCVLVGLAAGFHVQEANLYRREWNTQKAFFWQLAWRAPELQPGTILLTAELPFTVFSDNSLTAPLNWMYAPENTSRQMPYLMYAVESRLKLGLPRLESGIEIDQPYRATFFQGSTSQAVAIFSEPPGCLKVVDPVVDARLPQKPNYIAELLALSDPSRVIADPAAPAAPPQGIFGPEPEHSWCYYFEKADLARQTGDWQQAAKLAGQAFQLHPQLYEVNAAELVPFIEAYAHTGQWQKALALTRQAQDLTFRMKRMLCATWSRIGSDTPSGDEKQSALAQADGELKCSNP